MNSRVVSFAPVASRNARLLILGSMPGEASLKAGQYYAHPRNAFWPILLQWLGLEAGAPYAERLDALRSSGIALWDVLQSCRRSGSLDSAIEPESVVVNDFAAFFARHSHISQVCFNGAAAERCYQQHVLPEVGHLPLAYVRLPSTSPAHAALSPVKKAAAWHAALSARPALAVASKRSRSTCSGKSSTYP